VLSARNETELSSVGWFFSIRLEDMSKIMGST
jgi:hypothetical protein